jgi:hypothetical protein
MMGARAFRQLDVTRALKAAEATGHPYAVRIDRLTGDLLITPAVLTPGAEAALPVADQPEPDAWDVIRARRNGGHAA